MKKLKTIVLAMILVLGLGVVAYKTNDNLSKDNSKSYAHDKYGVFTAYKGEENDHRAVNEDKKNVNLKAISFNNADETKKVDTNKTSNEALKIQSKTVAKTSNKVTASRGNLKAVISYNAKELDLLARLVRAEAGGESYEAQVAVAAVVINRVKSSKFPNTITSVINSNNQFTPVQNGEINKPATASTKKAVQEALYGKDPSKGALFFYDTSCTSKWLLSKPVKARIGKMVYAY